jgi:predicted transposase YbfD/YdcC
VGCVIKVERSGTRGKEVYQSISYYLCSLSPSSRRLADGIRGHWLIENSLHWVKDVSLYLIENETALPELNESYRSLQTR